MQIASYIEDLLSDFRQVLLLVIEDFFVYYNLAGFYQQIKTSIIDMYPMR